MQNSQIDPQLRKVGDEIIRKVHAGEKQIILAGPAGTGKTHLIKYLVEQLGARVKVVAFTGQATRVLARRGIVAGTIHSTIYLPADKYRALIDEIKLELSACKKTKSDRKRRHQLEDELIALTSSPQFVLDDDSALKSARVCIIDEVSMLGGRLAEDLVSFKCPVVAVGDPFQLGPVEGKAYFDLGMPDLQLDKVFRQGEGSQILALATCLRGGFPYEGPRGDDVKAREHLKMNNDDQRKWMLDADQIICWSNATRRSTNRRMLDYLDLESRYPQGRVEKLICLRNHQGLGIMNGQPVRLTDVRDEGDRLSFTAKVWVEDEKGDWKSVTDAQIYKGHFDITADMLGKRKAKLKLANDDSHRGGMLELDWGYCITVHKAQGSEWEKVLVLDERRGIKNAALLKDMKSAKEADEYARRWLYTAVTRASKQLRIIKNWGSR